MYYGNVINKEKFKENKKEYEVEGYTMYLNQRTDRVGGGVVVYVRNKFHSSQVNDVKLDDSIESMWVDIRTNTNRTIRIGAFYRPPSQLPEKDSVMIDNRVKKGVY